MHINGLQLLYTIAMCYIVQWILLR